MGFEASGIVCTNKFNQIKLNQMQVFLRREENRSTRGKTSQSGEEYRQTQPKCNAESRNRTQATFLAGECSSHFAIATTALCN